jgi:hypothetical protein
MLAVVIPTGMNFSNLALVRDPDRRVGMDIEAMCKVLETSNICPDCFFGNHEMMSLLLTTWYNSHLARGGAPDPVMEQLKVEAHAEQAFEAAAGDKFIHEPGNA